jgi:hypothetical protein
MASAAATQKFFANNKVEMFHHAPAAAATEQSVKAGATTTTWKDLRDYDGFAVLAMLGLKTGNGLIELSIYAAEDDSGTNATEIKTSGVVAADAVGDYVMLECSAEEIAQLGRAAGYDLRYVAGYVDCHHDDDEVEVTYIRFGCKAPHLDLSDDYISA